MLLNELQTNKQTNKQKQKHSWFILKHWRTPRLIWKDWKKLDGIRQDSRTRGLLKARKEYQPLSPDIGIYNMTSGTYTGQAVVVVTVCFQTPLPGPALRCRALAWE
jgi:hypothetical protein